METSLYKISFKDGSVFKVFCANRKQNDDMVNFIYQNCRDIKEKGVEVLESGIHGMLAFTQIMFYKK